jgi:hypothetical protein
MVGEIYVRRIPREIEEPFEEIPETPRLLATPVVEAVVDARSRLTEGSVSWFMRDRIED